MRAVVWGSLGPQVGAQYQVGAVDSRARTGNFGFRDQQHAAFGVGWLLNLANLGREKTAEAIQREALLESERKLETVRADVVRAAETSATQVKLIPTAKQQVDSAQEALRLAQTTFQAGNALTLDVLQAEDALNQARQSYAGAVVNYNKSQVNLLAAMGALDEASVATLPPQ